jgi:hypothetical protein
MDSNTFINYYSNQAGTGIGGFQGTRFQRGNGFLGTLYRSAVLPLLKYLGPKAFRTGIDTVQDSIGGENFMSALKKNSKKTAQKIAGDASERAMRFAQTGTGKRRRKPITQMGTGKRRRKSITQTGSGKRRRKSKKQPKRRNRRSVKRTTKKLSSIFI